MTSFLAGPLANAIAAGFRGKLLPGVIMKSTVTGRDALGDPTYTLLPYAVEGFADHYSAIMRAQAGIPQTDSKLILIAGLCKAVPAIQDKLQLGGQWWQIRSVDSDPAGAHYECQSFKTTAPE